jgi:hypothetical protein
MTPEIFKHPAFVPGVGLRCYFPGKIVVHCQFEEAQYLSYHTLFYRTSTHSGLQTMDIAAIEKIEITSGPWSLWNHAPSWAEGIYIGKNFIFWLHKNESHEETKAEPFTVMRRPPWMPEAVKE